jgi:hypothetical protein
MPSINGWYTIRENGEDRDKRLSKMKKSNITSTPPKAKTTAIPDPSKIPIKPAVVTKLVPSNKQTPTAPPKAYGTVVQDPKRNLVKEQGSASSAQRASPATSDRPVKPVPARPVPVVAQNPSKPTVTPVKPSSVAARPAPNPIRPVPVVKQNAAKPTGAPGKPSPLPAKLVPIPARTVPVIAQNAAKPAGAPGKSSPLSAKLVPIPARTVPVVAQNAPSRSADAPRKLVSAPTKPASKPGLAANPPPPKASTATQKIPVPTDGPESGDQNEEMDERIEQEPQPKRSSNKISWKQVGRNVIHFYFCLCLP